MAKPKKEFKIKTPKGTITRIQRKDGTITARLNWNKSFVSTYKENFSRAQMFVDSKCIRYMNPLTPRLTGMMIKSATLGTVIGSGFIEYAAPYARRQYYEHKTKAKWFETMKKGHKEKIMEGAAKLAAGGK
jgi:hypothetical protein